MYKTKEELLKGIESLNLFWERDGQLLKSTISNETYDIIEEYDTARMLATKYLPGYSESYYSYKNIAGELIGYSNIINNYVLLKPLFSDTGFTYRLFVADNTVDNTKFSKWFVVSDEQAKLMIQDILIKKDPPDQLIDYLQDINTDFRRMYELITFFNEVSEI